MFDPDAQAGEQEGAQADVEGLEPRQPGDDDGGVAVTGHDRRLQPAERGRGLDAAGPAGQSAAENHDQQGQPVVGQTGVAGGADIVAAGAQLVAEAAEAKQHPHRRAQDQAVHQAPVDAGRADGAEQGRLREGRGHGEAGWVLPHAVDEEFEQENGDVVAHQGDNDLARPQPLAEDGRDQSPETAGQAGGTDHQRQEDELGQAGQGEGDPGGADRAQGELAFGADVPDLQAEGHRHPEGAEKERDGLEQAVLDGPGGAEGPEHQHLEAGERGDALHGEQQQAEGQGKERGAAHHQRTAPARTRGSADDAQHHRQYRG